MGQIGGGDSGDLPSLPTSALAWSARSMYAAAVNRAPVFVVADLFAATTFELPCVVALSLLLIEWIIDLTNLID